MPTERIDLDWLMAHGGTRWLGHVNAGPTHQMMAEVIDKRTGRGIGLMMRDTTERTPQGRRTTRIWHVRTHTAPFQHLADALEALAIVRAADELEALGEISVTAPKGDSRCQ